MAKLDVTSILATLDEAGKRHNQSDVQAIQKIHDAAGTLGATCAMPDPQGDGTVTTTMPDTMPREAKTDSNDGAPLVEAPTETPLTGEVVPLLEMAVRRDNTVALKVISPGWGSSGFYSSEVLKRDGPKAFPKGLHMHWDHSTPHEDAQRPERSLRDLAAEFTSDARWEDNGKAGPGLYADAKVFGAYTDAVNELAPHIGVSIRAAGTAKPGEADGRRGPVIESITHGKSVDFVTVPGRGGEILQLFEAAGRDAPPAKGNIPVELTEALQKFSASQLELSEAQTRLTSLEASLTEAAADNARLSEALLIREAHDFATAELAKIDALPPMTRVRIAENFSRAPVVTKDKRLDLDGSRIKLREDAKSELDYLTSVTSLGAIRGMGTTQTVNAQESKDRLSEAFASLGLSDAAVKHAVGGHAN